MKLYMVLLGCKPNGRTIEQHDIFFGIAESPADLHKDILNFWPDADGKIHIDVWREVTQIGHYSITVLDREKEITKPLSNHLFFINLGGYKIDDFEEYHYKLLAVAPTMADAIKQSKKTAFYKHTGFKGASSHIDDKYGLDVDDFYKVSDLLNPISKKKYQIAISESLVEIAEDAWHIGYLPLKSFQ